MSLEILAYGHGKWSNQTAKDCFKLLENQDSIYSLFITIQSFNLKIID